eukprot:COSAG06_NODE_3839_length_4850_cov_1.534203_1_plen_114_part_00
MNTELRVRTTTLPRPATLVYRQCQRPRTRRRQPATEPSEATPRVPRRRAAPSGTAACAASSGCAGRLLMRGCALAALQLLAGLALCSGLSGTLPGTPCAARAWRDLVDHCLPL